MNIADYIPFGADNAVSREYLCTATGLTDRKMRKAIKEARQTVTIINMSDGNGYFRPTEKEKPLVFRWIQQEKSRVRQIDRSILAAEVEMGAWHGQL